MEKRCKPGFGKVYKIVNDVDSDLYIGSTCDSLKQRWANHKSAHKKGNMKLYHKMRALGIEHFRIELIEDVSDINYWGVLNREAQLIKELKANLNVNYTKY